MSNVVTTPSILDSSNTITSPSLRFTSFWGMNVILESEILSATIAQEFVVLPLNCSPIIRSDVLPVGPVRADITTVGADGLPVSTDS